MFIKCTVPFLMCMLVTTTALAQQDGWTTLTPQGAHGIRYDRHNEVGVVIVNNETLMSCGLDPQFPDDNKVILSPPSPLKKYVMVMCWDRGGKEAYVIDTRSNRVASRDVVPKHWRVIQWVSWSPDERFALVAAAGEVTNGDMAFVDLQTNRVEELHFKNFARNPQQQEEIQDFDPDGVAWINAKSFSLRLDVRCNPYDGDESCLTKVLRSHPARVTLVPFSISYGVTSQVRSTGEGQHSSARTSRTNKGIRSVDFRNFTFERAAGDGSIMRIVLRNGENTTPATDTLMGRGSELKFVRYVDFDGDGNEEALVAINTWFEAAGSYEEDDYYVFAYRDGSPVQIFHEGRPKSQGIRVVGKSLVISAPYWRAQDPDTSPYATEITVYRWRGNGFVRVSRNLRRRR